MTQYECSVCGYVYDESKEGTRWASLPDDWTCPVCGADRSQFESVGRVQAEGRGSQSAGGLLGRAALGHRVFGYVFLAIYLLLLVQMLPRLWTYQIEFPARTVVHISLGMAVGVILILKIAIVRFFRRLEASLVSALGTSLLVASAVLIGISVPAAFREAVATARLFKEENRERVQTQLAAAGLDEAECRRFASADSLRAGQRVLRNECVQCHDLRTVLARPRTPENWRRTVRRMAERATMMDALSEDEQWQVTAYLVALSPNLRQSREQERIEQKRRDQAEQLREAIKTGEVQPASYDASAAKRLFESKCSQCHATDLVADVPPRSEEKARDLVSRMVDEGLEATEEELSLIVRYLTETYAKPSE